MEKGAVKERFKNLGRNIAEVFHSDSSHILPLLLFSLCAGLLLVTLEAYAVSPLYNQMNLMSYDGPYFALMGNAMVEKGEIPYVDFFDIKGPYLFWLEALCALIHPVWGFYFVQCLLSGLGLFCIWLLIRRLVKPLRKRFLLLAVYVVFAFAVMEGNVCEDLFLFLPTCSLLLLLSLRDRDSVLSYCLSGLLDGMIVGFLFFVKFNLIAFPGACALAMAYLGLRRRQYGRLALGVACGLFGIALLLIPPFAYYGAIGHLDALIEWNFVREFAYLGSHSWGAERIACFVICLFLLSYFLFALIRWRSHFAKDDLVLAYILLFVQIIVALASYVSMRHLRFALPCFVYLASFPVSVFDLGKRWKAKTASAVSIFPYPALLILCIGFVSFTKLTDTRNGDWVNDELSEIGAQIPAEDRFEGGVLAIDMPSGVYFEIEAIPDFPFAAYHSIHSTQYVPEMMEMIVDYIETDATWVLVNDAPYEHKDVTPIYEFAEFDAALKESNFQLREDLSVEGLVMVYERV